MADGNYGFFYSPSASTGSYSVTFTAGITAVGVTLSYDGYTGCQQMGATSNSYTIF